MIYTLLSSLLLAGAVRADTATAATTTYDYIIIGAGPAGLTIANRLSASGSKSVLVLEAGLPHLNDPAILIPGYMGGTVGNPDYDWNFVTVPQTNAGNRSIPWNRGKAIGGSTAINFMAYGRPASGEIDAVDVLQGGNSGWDWNTFFKYIKKAEHFTAPYAPYAAQENFTYNPAYHGTSGPISTSFPAFVSGAQLPWTDSLKDLGVLTLQDAAGGDDVGAWYSIANIDNSTKTRSYAANYYTAAVARSNYKLITSAMASKIISTGSSPNVVATGVEYFVNATRFTASLKFGGEVIVSAGAINSPKILELSGIGNPAIMNPLGIATKVNLTGVGENIIDQMFTGLSYELKDSSVITLDDLRNATFAAAALAEYEATKTGIMTIGVTAFSLLPLKNITDNATANELIKEITFDVANADTTLGTKATQAEQIAQLLLPKNFGLYELVGFPGFFTAKSAPASGKKYLTFTVDLQFPFSRGNIHISSSNYTVQPTINPNYFQYDFDMTSFVEAVKFTRKLATTGGFASVLGAEADPGASVSTDAEIEDYIRNYAGTEYHTVGSCAMLPQKLGGVVSPELVVYGTTNIRVADLSILPLQISAHPQSTVYGIGEKAADLIMGVTTV